MPPKPAPPLGGGQQNQASANAASNISQRPSVFGNKGTGNPAQQQQQVVPQQQQKAPVQQQQQVPQQQQQQQQQQAEDIDKEPTLEGDEEMPATERDLADDAPWKRIQQNTFTRWANEHLKTVNKGIGNLETDLSDGLRLCALIEVLSGKKLPRHNKRPTFRSQKLENVSVALNFLQEDENIKLVNIDSTDIVDGRLKLILGLIWTLILHYSISMPMWADEDEGAKDLTPKQRLLRWIQNKIPDLPVNNFTSDWNDGRAVGALVDAVAPGLCPDWADWNPKNAKKNATEAMKLAEDWLDVPQLIRPEEMVDPNVDELSMMTYLSQFPNARLKPGAPLHGKLAPNRVRAYGPGLEAGCKVGVPAKFTVETFSAGSGTVEVQVLGPDGSVVPSIVKFNNDRNKTYSCQYVPKMEGVHRISVSFAGAAVPKSPFEVDVRGYAGDASKVTAKGPGLDATGNQMGKPTWFEVFTKGAGDGLVEVIIMDAAGRKDTVIPTVKQTPDGVWRVDYTAHEMGLHSVNVFFAGKPIPHSPFGVKIGPVSDSRKVRCTGRGLQKNGVRVRDVADFKIWTEGAGEGKLEVKIIGPGGVQEHFDMKKLDSTTFECKYYPKNPGRYTVIVMYGGQEVPKSPFEVNVGKYITSKVRAFGPGLEGGVVGHSADFCVEMNGETAPLGFSIEGPSQAKIDCKDNGDQTADVKYWPTAPGEYAVHVLCNDEDIPGSPFMAQIKNMPDGVNPDKVKVFGPGVEPEGVQTGRPTEFTIDCREAGKANLHVSVMDVDYNPVNVTVRDMQDGTYKVTYTATRSVKHTVSVNYADIGVPKSPFRVFVQEPTNPSKVRVYGPGVEPGVRTATPTHFTVDCAHAGPGDVQIALQNEKGQDVPFKINDNRDGTFTVDYTAPSPGTYKVTVSFAGKEVPCSPIKVQVAPHIDVSGIKVEGLEQTVPVNSKQQIKIVSTSTDSKVTLDVKDIVAEITTASKKKIPVTLTATSDGKIILADFVPTELGVNELCVKVGGQVIPKQPQKFTVSPNPDHTRVIVEGPGLKTGEVGVPAKFRIDSRKAGVAPVGLTIDGPAEVKIDTVDNKDGTVDVTYHPTAPGDYDINVSFNGKPVPGSPFKPTIAPKGGFKPVDVSGIRVEGLEPSVPVNSKQQIKIACTGQTAQLLDVKLVTAEIITASKKKIPVTLTSTPDGKAVLADFVPTELGENQLTVKVSGQVIPKQPQKFNVSPTPDASKVKVEGPGLTAAEVGTPAKFRIDTRKAGVAPMGLTIDGPAEVKIETVDNKDGTIDVTYHTTAPGDYDINVLFNQVHVPGSTFKPKVAPKGGYKAVDVSGIRVEGLDQTVPINSKQQIKIVSTDQKAPPLNVSEMTAEITTASKKKISVKLTPTPDGKVVLADFTPTELGENQLVVKVGGQVIPKQPQKFNVSPNPDPSKVKVEGPGLTAAEVGTPGKFRIDTRKAGVAPLGLTIDGPAEVKIDTVDNKDGTIDVSYHPTVPGDYDINVSFNQQPVPGSPFKPKVAPKGGFKPMDVSGIKVEGLDQTVPVNSKQQITVVSTDQKVVLNISEVTAEITTASKKKIPVKLTQSPDGKAILADFIPTELGESQLVVAVRGQQIPKQPQKFTVSPTPDASKVKVEGPGLTTAEVGVPGKFRIDTRKAGIAPLGLNIDGPAEVKIDTIDNKDGTIDVSYHTTVPGDYDINVSFNQQPVPGSPFKPKVAPKGGFKPIDVSGIKVEGLDQTVPVHSKQQIKVISTDQKVVLNISEVTAEITTASKKKIPVKLTPSPDGKTILADFVPTELGESQLVVAVRGQQIPKQPQKFTVSPTPDASKVKVEGPGLTTAEVGIPGKFRIDTRKAGIAPLGLNIDGPAEVKIDTVDNKDGTIDVTYHTTVPGDYDINVAFNQQPVPGSPFKPKVAPKGGFQPIDVSGIKVEGLDQSVPVNSKQQIKVVSTDQKALPLNINEITAEITTVSKKKIPVKLTATPDGKVVLADFTPTELGETLLTVAVRGQPIPKQPQKFVVSPTPDASKVKVEGPGLNAAEVGVPGKFRIDTRKAGVAPLGLTIDGPAEVKIDTVDNKDGTVDVTYHTTVPGDYDVNVAFNNQPVPGSPFKPKVAPKGGFKPVDVSQIKVEGLDQTVPINSKQQIKVAPGDQKAPSLSVNEVTAEIITASKKKIPVKITPAPDGKAVLVDFVPTEVGENQLVVNVGGKPIPNQPQKFNVSPTPDPSKVKVEGPGLTAAEVGTPAKFRIDSRKAGVAPLGLTVNGPAEVKIDTVDNKDGTVDVTYHPVVPGEYDVNVSFNQQPVPGSPFKPKVAPKGGAKQDLSSVKVDGLDQVIPLHSRQQLKVASEQNAVPLNIKEVTAEITTATGKKVPVKLTPTQDQNGILLDFMPMDVGENTLNVKVNGQPIPKQPQKFTVSPNPDVSKVVCEGPGLTTGEAGVPCKFRIDTRKAGMAPVGMGIDGPAEAKIETFDNKDGTVDVSYLPTAPGEYDIKVTFNQQPVPGGPFKAKIGPKGGPKTGPDVTGVKVNGPGITGAFLDSMTEFTVDARSVTRKGEGKVKVIVTSPAGIRTEALVSNKQDGIYTVDYSVFEEGKHTLEVTYEGIPVPGAPFKVNAVRGSDHTKCKAYGPGLQGGYTNVSNQFTVETKGAGTGGLALAIEGPSEAKMTCKDNRDGTCLVDYTATESGEYDITIKFADKHIPGSPFKVQVDNPVDSSRVRAYGPGVEPNKVRANVPANFKIDATKSGRAPVAVDVTSDRGPVGKKPEVYDNGDGTFDVSYLPPPEGANCKVRVTHGGKDIPGSPFQTKVLPTCEPQKVVVSGPGVNKNGVPASMPAEFIVDTREAGYSDLKVLVQGPDGKPVRTQIEDLNDGTYKVRYVPEDLGNYNINVLYGNQPVKGAPFNIKTYPTGDASKVKIVEGVHEKVVINQEYRITVNTMQAGVGNVTCKISGNGQDFAVDIQDNGDGTISLFYTMKEAGDYTINIKYGGQPVPGGTYKVKATTEEIITQKTVERTTTRKYRALELTNIPLPLGGGSLSGLVIMPSGKQAQPDLTDNKDGTVTVRYQPTEAGQHEMHVKYANSHVQGSPFKFFVDQVDSGNVTAFGPGLTHGIAGEPCFFTINTREAGSGGLSVAVEGPSKADITCQDNKDGTCSVSYFPVLPGEYKIIVKFADKHINGSPFTAKITGEGKKRNQISVGTASEISLMVQETDVRSLTATIKSPSGLEEPCMLKSLPNGHLGISFTPRETGEHQVIVTRNGKPIQGSPFKVKVGDKEIGNASRVKVIGNVKEGKTQQLNEFTVNTKDAGYGGLSVSVEGPSKADIHCSDNPDGTLKVGYKPTEPGTYTLNVRFADQNIPGSPFTVKVTGEGAHRQTERITHSSQTVQTSHVGNNCELQLKLPGSDPFDMKAQVTSPSGKTEDAELVDLADSAYKVRFVPTELGVHTISVKHKSMHIPGSPFQFTVGPLKDGGPHRVRAGGPGLERGEVGEPCDFNVWTREAGAGNLSIAVEGPSKAAINFKDHKDGSCYVTYKVTEPGEYNVSIKYNDQHIPDSPYKVYVTPSIGEAKKIEVGALHDNLPPQKPVAFTVNTHGVKGKLSATVVTPTGKEEDCMVTPVDDNVYAVRFMPYDTGVYFVHVRFNGVPIRGSPFRVRVGKEEADPAQVMAYGKGLESIVTGEKGEFVVNTTKAGAGTLAVTIDGPSKVAMDCSEVDEGYKIRYTPVAPGDYFVAVKYNGSHIAGSPYRVPSTGKGRAGSVVEKIQPSQFKQSNSVIVETVTKSETTTKTNTLSNQMHRQSDASKVAVKGAGIEKAYQNKQNTFTVKADAAGHNVLLVGVYGQKNPAEEVHVKHTGHDAYSVSYVLKERGEYLLIVKYGEDHIPGSPFLINCV